MTYTTDDADRLIGAYSKAIASGEGSTGALLAVANLAEEEALERAADADTTTGLLAGLVHEVGRIANSLNGTDEVPPIHADRIVEAWEAVGMRMHEDKAIALLERLGFTVEQPERTHRI